MPTCPNCGEIVMKGDPYCPNCGTIFSKTTEYEENIIDEFKYDFNRAKSFYHLKHYEDGFYMLRSASGYYKKMSDSQKSQVRAEPFREYWVRELCCQTVNLHARHYIEAAKFITEHNMAINLCRDCDLLYPRYVETCEKCGKPLESNTPTPEETEKTLRESLEGSFYSETQIDRMARGTANFMKSNGCTLVEIRDMGHLNLDFIFEKEHRYFTTTYACRFDFEYRGMRTFTDVELNHSYDRLFADESFQKAVSDIENKTGFRFRDCVGGFNSMRLFQVDLLYTDDISFLVRFDVGDGRIATYHIDFDSMKLSEDDVIDPENYNWGECY